MQPTHDEPRDRLARPMFWLAFASLLILAGDLYRYHAAPEWERATLKWLSLAIWPVFWVEALYRLIFLAEGVRRTELTRAALYVALPPFRMGAPSLIRPGRMWLPFAGWRDLNSKLEDDLQRWFAVPMIVFALLIIPLLVVEYTKKQYITDHQWLRFSLDAGVALIWVAFALEFIIKVSAARRTGRFVKRHWIDLAIVLIPAFELLLRELSKTALAARLLRLVRVLNPQYLARMGQVYRLRGLLGRAWAAALVLGLLHRVIGRDPLQAQLDKLRAQEDELLEDLEELRRKKAEVEGMIARRDAECARDGAPPPEDEVAATQA